MLFVTFIIGIICLTSGSAQIQLKCGQLRVSNTPENNKIVGGLFSQIGEFPWMALIVYDRFNRTECAASVINRKFLLTAAHCIAGIILSVHGRPKSIRLGEYDTTSNPDCTPGGICAARVVDNNIQLLIPHPRYMMGTGSWQYDIGMIKVVDEIVFSDYVQPICLPLQRVQLSDTSFHIAGWGKTKNASTSNIILRTLVPYVLTEICQKIYHNQRIREDQICAGGKEDQDSCSGDSGGPLMFFKFPNWFVYGIVSLGPSKCGQKGYPALYTRVDLYKDWILNVLTGR